MKERSEGVWSLVLGMIAAPVANGQCLITSYEQYALFINNNRFTRAEDKIMKLAVVFKTCFIGALIGHVRD